MISYAFGLVAGATVAVVLVDAAALIPFLVLPLAAAPVVHLLRGLSVSVRLGLALAAVVFGSGAVLFGYYVSSDGTVQALGVLGGSATIAVGATFIAWLGFQRLRQRGGPE